MDVMLGRENFRLSHMYMFSHELFGGILIVYHNPLSYLRRCLAVALAAATNSYQIKESAYPPTGLPATNLGLATSCSV